MTDRNPLEPVELAGVTKVFGETRALGGVSMRLDGGRPTALLGPNGSGKSTLLRIVAGEMSPTSGTVRYGGESLSIERRRRIGFVAHEPLVYLDLTARENLVLHARLGGLDAPGARAASLIDSHRMAAFADRPARTYSRGQLQRLQLARALVADPDLLLLDEPTAGLDAAAVEHLRELLGRARARGVLLVFATHDDALVCALDAQAVHLESA